MSFSPAERVISFGPFRLYPERRLLLEGDHPLRLGTRALEILIALIEQAGERVGKDELILRVWPDTTVEEANLRVHLSALRRALGDGRDGNRYIVTDSGRGYRFVAPVKFVSEADTTMPSATKRRHNLPAMLTRLIGRSDTVNALVQELPHHRFVTLVGGGGVGTTSVALAVAETLLGAYEDGVWLADLAPLADARLVPSAVAAALALDLDTEATPLVALKDKQALLVFDNCERVIDSAAALAVAILKEAPGVNILATSREALNAEGEHVRRLQPLAAPPSSVHLTASRALAFPAIQLFAERASARLPEYELTDADAPILADICAKLDGIPLAIEFAAAKMDAFGIQGLAAHLDDRLRLLTMGRRSPLTRHQTLRATLDWSYDLLSPMERLLLQRLGVFQGRFTLEGARKVVAADGLQESEIADGIVNLVAKSLVTADVGGTLVLYRLLETTRAYAREKLLGSGTGEAIARRHAEYYRDLMEGDEAKWGTTHPMSAGLRKDRYCIDDIRAALDWAFSPGGDQSIGVALTAAAIPLWMELSLMVEARERVERALLSIDPGLDRRTEKQLHAALGASLFFSPGSAGFANAAKRVTELADSLDETEHQLGALWRLWSYRTVSGEYGAALALAEKFRNVALRARLPSDHAIGERLVGITYHYLGEQAEAQNHLERMLDNYDPAASNSHIERFQVGQRAAALAQLARVQWLRGFPEQAAATAGKAIDEANALEHPSTICYALAVATCPVALFEGDLEGAERAVTALHDQATLHQMSLWLTWAAGFQGTLRSRRGDVEGLSLLGDAVAALREGRYFVPLVGLLGDLGEALGRAGRAAEGLAAVDEALERVSHTDERWCLPELLRIKGDLLLLGGRGDAQTAEECFEKSLELAQKQAVPSWRLRTATSFARLRRSQGRMRAAHDLLAPAYSWFTEGLDTADLMSAKALLDTLA